MSILNKTPVKLTSLLSFIFFFSGFSALMYQVAWQRLLTVYYGVGSISITLIVSVYMFGLGVGALFGGVLSEKIKNKIILYFLVEFFIGCFGLVSLPFLDFLGRQTAGSSYLLSFFYMFLFLSFPTFLMGITLPLLTKIFNQLIKNFLNTVSFLYFINTIGAAIGSIFTSYVIISFFGLSSAVYCAATMNFFLAVLILISKYMPVTQREEEHVSEASEDRENIFGRIAYLLVFITGFLAIGYELVWFRVVGILVKASPYAFSSVLSVYLLGIALGSFGMMKYLKRSSNSDKKSLFFLIQFLIGIIVLLTFTGYFYLTRNTFLHFFTLESFRGQIHPSFLSFSSISSVKELLLYAYRLFDVLFWPIIFVFTPTILMGASFPLISFLALKQRNKEGKTVGTVYFFNIAGNVFGGIATGFLLLPYFGTEPTLLGFSLVGVLFGILISSFLGRQLPVVKRIVLVLLLSVLTVIFFPKRGELYDVMHISPGNEYKAYFEEGRDGTIMTYKLDKKVINYINGLPHGARPYPLYNYKTFEAISYAKKVDNVLIIGYGTGSITEEVLKMDNIRKVTLVELNSALIKNLRKITFFKEMLADKRLKLIIDDGRRFLLRTDEKFDLILMDPLRCTTSYSNNLYSLQFFKLANQHLNTNGIFMLWKDEHRVIPKTVMSAFSHFRIYNNFCLASNSDFKRNKEHEKLLFDSYSPEIQKAVLSFASRESMHVGDQDHNKNLVADYPVNQDWKPVTEYYIGLLFRNKFCRQRPEQH